ncbi:MAG: type 1 glutamine amidotransferase domain-containing protein [Levilactobacillus sp.]|jgi:putative intracellular protease/amidase|uniref:type 1 glutamine amidotransferase domain-containing protein n=1 Tax=Levilactobacillus sp. TaxID=2767919 RepID=UPI00258738DA|nr:type 1 glutamine amidotransferase domain-containing protein [Levilactobacillus sp.]MCI1554354.1 type 1 glutamine amidotransferase domain-containing protein [Levilactobacillus sp.]MCI1599261.1 type 1 glutamine amidotransferase domain-containing protein [Levilactobacillus sp.]MCI1605741.1 type 1 glutamine amidotransferase domain-containing protein [Levilactobacillus sp.]
MQSKNLKKMLIVLTNTTRYGQTTDPTGLWLSEATEFALLVQQAGYQVDYVSPQGGFVPLDPRSMKYTDEEIMTVYETADFQQRALMNSLRPAQVVPADYVAIYYAGGHGVMWDFPDDEALQTIAAAIYGHGGYVTSVCHGIAGLLNIRTASGAYLIANHRVTGFTKAEEVLAGKRSVVPFFNQAEVQKRGAIFTKKRAYKTYAVQDERLITGQNPFSAKAVAQLLLQALAEDV